MNTAVERAGLTVTDTEIRSITDRICPGCGRYMPRGAYIDAITAEVWCDGCGDPRNSTDNLVRIFKPTIQQEETN